MKTKTRTQAKPGTTTPKRTKRTTKAEPATPATPEPARLSDEEVREMESRAGGAR